MLHASEKNKQNYSQLFFYFKISFVKKIRSTLKENINQFFGFKKFRFVFKEDTNNFLLKNYDCF